MSHRQNTAESCLIATCAHLALTGLRNDNWPVWRDVLRGVLPDCADCRENLIPMRVAAAALVNAVGSDRGSRLARLRVEVQYYFTKAAADRLEKWRALTGGDVVE